MYKNHIDGIASQNERHVAVSDIQANSLACVAILLPICAITLNIFVGFTSVEDFQSLRYPLLFFLYCVPAGVGVFLGNVLGMSLENGKRNSTSGNVLQAEVWDSEYSFLL